MVVVAIVAITAMAGIPAYTSYLQKASINEAITTLANYKEAISLFWSTEDRLPTTGDTLNGTPVDLPFGTAITNTATLPSSIQSLTLSASGNGVMIAAVVQVSTLSSASVPNRTITLGALVSGSQVIYQCGNYTTNAALATDIGIININTLPNGCNYNGVGAWLNT